jgi:hypothetical protein
MNQPQPTLPVVPMDVATPETLALFRAGIDWLNRVGNGGLETSRPFDSQPRPQPFP